MFNVINKMILWDNFWNHSHLIVNSKYAKQIFCYILYGILSFTILYNIAKIFFVLSFRSGVNVDSKTIIIPLSSRKNRQSKFFQAEDGIRDGVL